MKNDTSAGIKPDFSERSRQTEIMDDLEGAGPDWHQALRELKVINKYLGGNQLTLKGINELLKGQSHKGEVSVADLGCGGGDMLMEIARWGRRKGLKMRLMGVDANPNIIAYAKENTAAYPEIEFLTADIFSEKFSKERFDIVTCTLFTHHFESKLLTDLISQLNRQVRVGLLINDLHRHWLAYYSIKAITKVASRSRMVQHDAPVSVLRAFSRKDWLLILAEAGVNDFDLYWRWAFRWMLLIRPDKISNQKSSG